MIYQHLLLSIYIFSIPVHKVIVWDSEKPHPTSDFQSILLWRSFGDKNHSNIFSIPQLIEENSDSLRSRYLAWVYELGELRIKGKRLIDHLEFRPGFSYWWMTLLSEKANYSKSPQITDAISLLAFSDWASNKTLDTVILVSTNQALADCLDFWCKKSGVAFKWKRLAKKISSLSFIRRAYALLPRPLQALTFLMHYLIDRWPLRGVGLNDWRNSEGRLTFVSYLFNLEPEAAKTGRYESLYWGHLPQVLKSDGCNTNWLHIYSNSELLPDARKAADIINIFNESGQAIEKHTVLDTFLSLSVVLLTLKDWALLALKAMSLKGLIDPVPLDKVNLWPLFATDWYQSTVGAIAITNSLYCNLFDAAMKALPKQNAGFYLQENQGWEFALIQTWKISNHCRLIGVPHSSVRFWDLRYFFDPRSYSQFKITPMPLPSQVALNGKAATDAYLAGGYPTEGLIQVEALRYLHLNNVNKMSKADLQHKKYGLRLLVLGDYLESNTRRQMRLLTQVASLLPDATIISFKPHPACPIRVEDYPDLSLLIVSESLAKLLFKCDVAYTSSVTSAAVDAYCFGIPVVSVSDPNILNMSPLRRCRDVSFVTTPDELIMALTSITSTLVADSRRQYVFNLDKSLTRWRHILASAT